MKNKLAELHKEAFEYLLDAGAEFSHENYADYLSKHRVVALPCEVNDTIYVIFSQFKNEISKCRVDEITVTDRGIYVVVDIYYPRYVAERATSFPISWFGKFAFHTKDEVEQKMKEFMYDWQ